MTEVQVGAPEPSPETASVDPVDSLLAAYSGQVEEQRGKRRVTFEVAENRERGLLPLALTLRAMDRESLSRCTRGRDVEEGNTAIIAAATVEVHVEVDGKWVTVGSGWDEQLAARFGRQWTSPRHLVRDVFPDDIALASYADDYGRWVGFIREASREVAVGEGSASST